MSDRVAERYSIKFTGRTGDYYRGLEIAVRMKSHWSHGWVPNLTDYMKPHNGGYGWFTFTDKSDALMFKLSFKVGE